MLKAKELIREKRYTEARELLKHLDHNPTAREWIKKIDAILIAEDNPFAEAEAEAIDWEKRWQEDRQSGPGPTTSRSVQMPRRRQKKSNAGMLGLLVIVAVAAVAIPLYLVLVYLPEQEREQIFDDMVLMCLDDEEMSRTECIVGAEWAMAMIEEFGLYDEMKTCLKDGNTDTINGRESIRDCLEPLFGD